MLDLVFFFYKETLKHQSKLLAFDNASQWGMMTAQTSPKTRVQRCLIVIIVDLLSYKYHNRSRPSSTICRSLHQKFELFVNPPLPPSSGKYVVSTSLIGCFS